MRVSTRCSRAWADFLRGCSLEPSVHLVGEPAHPVRFDQSGDLLPLSLRRHPSGRIVGCVGHQQPCSIEETAQFVDVDLPIAVGLSHLPFTNLAADAGRDLLERLVAGGLDHHGVAGFQKIASSGALHTSTSSGAPFG